MAETAEQQPIRDISLSLMVDTVRAHKLWILLNLLIVGVIAVAIALFLPKYYHSESRMVIEENSYIAASMKKVGVSMNINIGDPQKIYDAYLPKTYPDLVNDNRFLCHAILTPVKTRDGKKMLYGEFLRKHHERLTAKDRDPIHPSPTLDTLMRKVKKDIKFRSDYKRSLLYINVQSSDPLVCQQVCQEQCDFLLKFIADYRLKKKTSEVQHFKAVADSLKKEYMAASRAYAVYADSNLDAALPSVRKDVEMLENEATATKNLYENVKVEYMSAKARLQDATPAFITIEQPAIPAKRTGPNRFLFILAALFVTLLYSVIFFMRKTLWAQITR